VTNLPETIQWQKQFTRALSLYKTQLYVGNLVKGLKKHFNFELNSLLCHGIGEEVGIYVGKEDYNLFGHLILDHFLTSIQNNKDPFELLDNIQKNQIQTAINAKNRKLETKEELIEEHNKFIEALVDYQIVIWFPAVCEDVLFPYAKQKLSRITNKEAWDIVSDPYEPSVIQQEYIDLLKVASNFSEEMLEKHTKNYEWMAVRFVEDEPYDKEYYRKRIQEIKDPKQELERINNELAEKKQKFFDLINSLKCSEKDKEIFKAVNKLNLLRNTRDNGRRRAYFHAKYLYEKIKEFLGCDYKILMSYLPKEVNQAIENNIQLKEPKNVSEYAYFYKGNSFNFLADNKAREWLKTEGLVEEEKTKTDSIKGTVASHGKVTGKVKVIRLNTWREDIAKVNKGDILVSVSTKPDYIVAMEKASAFITDEGGLTAHAAIVAREMKKPCIVGTGNSTKVLNDNDLVEVDAENGVIRKL
jgi:phosphohistidine swiveling domain-containing protein